MNFIKVYWLVGIILITLFVIPILLLIGFVVKVIFTFVIIPSISVLIDFVVSNYDFIVHFIYTLSDGIVAVLNIVWCWIIALIYFIHEYSSPGDILLMMGGILATFIGIALPISISVVGEHLRPYKDSDISNYFRREPEFKTLLFSLCLFPVLIGLHLFKVNYLPINIILLVLASYLFFTLFQYFKLVLDYIIKTDEIIYERQLKEITLLDQLENEATRRETLFKALGRIGVVAMSKLEKGQSQAFLEILDDLEKIFDEYLLKFTEEPKKFNPLFSRVIVNKDESNFISDELIILDENEIDIFVPKRVNVTENSLSQYLSDEGLQKFTNVFDKMYVKAQQLRDSKSGQTIIQTLNSILCKISSNQTFSKKMFYKPLLNFNTNILLQGLNEFREIDYHLYQSYYLWYLDCVFQDEFSVENIKGFNNSLFVNSKTVIEKNNSILFQAFVSSAIDRHLDPLYVGVSQSIYRFDQHDLRRVTELVSKIDLRIGSLYSINQYLRIQKELGELRSKYNYIHPVDVNEFYQRKLEYILNRFKYNNLKMVFIWIGTYCHFKQKYNLLEHLLYYHLPKDTQANWGNNDISPTRIDEIIDLLLSKYEIERDVMFIWGGHSDFNLYFDEYILILIAKTVSQTSRYGKSLEREDYDDFFNGWNKIQVNTLLIEFRKLHKMAIRLSKYTDNFLNKLSFNNKFIAIQLLPLLKKLKISCEDRIEYLENYSKLKREKIEYFENEFVKVYHQKTVIKNIIEHYFPSEKKIFIPPSGQLSIGLKEVFSKDYFVNDNQDLKVGVPVGLAYDLVFQSNNLASHLLVTRNGKSIKVSEKDVQKKIDYHFASEDNSEDLIIIGINMDFPFQKFGNEKEFVSRFNLKKEEPWWDMTRLVGWFKRQEVFNFNDNSRQKGFFILDKNHLGKIIQYIPRKDAKEKYLHDIFYMTIESYSENPELLAAILDEQPQWLKEMGDQKVQKSFLLKQVKIRIMESFTIEFDKDFYNTLTKLDQEFN
jgi:hypothetical protein